MNILILDRAKNPGLMEYYEEGLRKRGHQVTSSQLLTTMEEYYTDPENYLS